MRYIIIKRIFDIFFGIVGILFLVPFCIILKIVYVCMGDMGKIIYRQIRIGKDGREINIFKFRSMVTDAEQQLEELLKDGKYKEEWQKKQKIEDDPRITTVGKYLRLTSLDELPQVINVLKGEMSVVGPRPLVAGELEAHGGESIYWKVKPGITGWWACHGRSNLNYNERLEMEYYYIRNRSIKLDFICIFMTIGAVVGQKGAK